MQKFVVLLAILVLALAACGGGGSPSPLNESNAWRDPFPVNAELVSPEEFRRLLDTGETELVSTASQAAQKAARDAQFKSDKSVLQSQSNPPAFVQDLLLSVGDTSTPVPDKVIETPSGLIALNGNGTQLREAVTILEQAQSVDNALADYTLTYSLLPTAIVAQAPTPASLGGKTLSEIQAALRQVNDLLGSPAAGSSLRTARLETNLKPQAFNPGNGTDNSGVCMPQNLVKKFWFPLKNFVSPMKSQGRRGTCWAFTAIGALESRERVQNNNPVDLSEQFFVNKIKREWDSSDDEDGYFTEKALQLAFDKRQALPSEATWTYNRSLSRPNGSYDNSCNGYNTDNCSNTAHQSKQVCTTVVFRFCSYVRVNYTGTGISSTTTTQVWANGGAFDLNRYRLLLSQGYVLLASFPVYKGFMDDVTSNGVVSNYAKTRLNDAKPPKEVAGSYGGHAVQIVGFLSNEDMTLIGQPAVNIGGGGYFIVKNSWGCSGDGGYYYLPADYVSQMFNRLSVLNFDARRSNAWNREQTSPGGTEAAQITILNSSARADLRVESNLAAFFSITHPVAKSVNLTATSDLEGQLYNGAWNVGAGLFGSDLKKTFTRTGVHTISLLAKYGSAEARANFRLNVTNTPPTLELQYSGSPKQNEEFLITALVRDINESDNTVLCSNTTWQVDGSDTLSSPTGCTQRVRFLTQGDRQVRVSTRDSEGAIATQTLTLTVEPPPVNPYPRIVDYGVYSRELIGNANFRFCGSVAQPAGRTIDLGQQGCTFLISQPRPQRYYGGVDVENPSNETLTYNWQLMVTNPTTGAKELLYSGNEPVFNLFNIGNAVQVTRDCEMKLTVGAPEPSRSKSLTVWSGKCTYLAGRLN